MAIKLWAHRGCSLRCPENTLTAFRMAARLPELVGIELDIQQTRDHHLVVIHDERVDRTTDGIGMVKDYSLAELKTLRIQTGKEQAERIPTMDEVFQMLFSYLKNGLQLNIELKNSNVSYEGMEERILDMAARYGLQEHILYSSFYAKSLVLLSEMDANARIAILDNKLSDCMYKAMGMGRKMDLHPYWQGMDLGVCELNHAKIAWEGGDYTIRAWMGGGHLFPEKPTGKKLDLEKLEAAGIQELILNEPEAYLS